MNKKKSIIATILVISLLILTYTIVKICTSNGSDLGIKVKVGDVRKMEKKKIRKEYTFQDLEGLKQFVLHIPVGFIDMKKSSDDTVKVSATYELATNRKEDLQRLEDNIKLMDDRKEDYIQLEIVTSDGQDLWEWAEKEVDGFNVSANLEIEIPEQFQAYDIKVGTGSVQVNIPENEKSMAMLSLETEVGNININLNGNRVEYKENTERSVDAFINDAYHIKGLVDTGSIHFKE